MCPCSCLPTLPRGRRRSEDLEEAKRELAREREALSAQYEALQQSKYEVEMQKKEKIARVIMMRMSYENLQNIFGAWRTWATAERRARRDQEMEAAYRKQMAALETRSEVLILEEKVRYVRYIRYMRVVHTLPARYMRVACVTHPPGEGA